MWYTYAMKYYSPIKYDDTMKFECNWIELDNIILSEVTGTPKDMHGIDSLTSGY